MPPRFATVDDINAAANHPAVLPFCAPGYATVDARGFYAQPGNVAFGSRTGVIILGHQGDGVYEWHWLITPAARGAHALKLARDVADYAFTKLNARVLYGLVPRGHRAARLMTRTFGARPAGEGVSPSGLNCIRYVLERDSWKFSAPDSVSSAH